MRKLLFALCLLTSSVTGCKLEIVYSSQQDALDYPEFTAEVEPFDSNQKTSLNENRCLVWSAGDQLAIFQGNSLADRYQVKDSADGQMNASYSIVHGQDGSDGDYVGSMSFDTNIAFYPYQSGLECAPVYDDEDNVISYRISGVAIPAVQSYLADSFAEESYMMAAVTSSKSDHVLKFKNVCGALKFQLTGTAKVKRIELKGNANESLAGSAVITAYPAGVVPSIEMAANASKTVTLDCGSGVQLNKTTPTIFMISLPPTAFAKGFTATVISSDGSEGKLSTTKANPVTRSKIKAMPAVEIKMNSGVDMNPEEGNM